MGLLEKKKDSVDYDGLLTAVKSEIQGAQVRASSAVSAELVFLYWKIGSEIVKRQEEEGWGAKVIKRLSADLRASFPGNKGYSQRNLDYMRKFAELWPDLAILQPVVAKLGWTQHIQLIDHFGDEPKLYVWYAIRAAERGWSKRELQAHIANNLHVSEGSSTTNFNLTLPEADLKTASQAIRDPYVLDFIQLEEGASERSLEDALVKDIERFLRELGEGFFYCGRQKPLIVGSQEFFMDLLFYNHTMRRFVIIELKMGEFKAEYAGKMNLYLNACDSQLKGEFDKESVGLILCTHHNQAVSNLTLQGMSNPISIASWTQEAATLPEGVREDLQELPEVAHQLEQMVVLRSKQFALKGEAYEIQE